jgi:flagellar protein FliS
VDSYLEQQILSASPLELIDLSYRTAIQAVRDARRFLAEKRILERSRCITRAHSVIAHLYSALDFKAGDGSMARQLGLLYDYMMRKLLEANAKQTDKPLEEVLGLLLTLSEAWSQISAITPPATRSIPADSTDSTVSYGNPCYIDTSYAEVDESRYSLSF